ncbi:hypothetical protein E2562_038897 [Oryza meyeriana var. granulata]|uniref:Uncharacterized protein n=1 Tax=Oryza meyeriana var. granulata TaxID=110450 RepID=A0A6G1CBJ3_9ORYZ|nr:hypothetical protein E2562_038897 [Oryza meyeriana var. granulata]
MGSRRRCCCVRERWGPWADQGAAWMASYSRSSTFLNLCIAASDVGICCYGGGAGRGGVTEAGGLGGTGLG